LFTSVESFEDTFYPNAADKNGKSRYCSEDARRKKADHNIQAKGNKQ